MSDFQVRTMKRKNVKGLALKDPPAGPAIASDGDAQIPGAHRNDKANDTLEIGVEFKLDLRTEDLQVLKELGAGNGGTVSKVKHLATNVVMARKVIHVEAKENVRKQIVRELHIMHDCHNPNIVTFHGAFLNDAGDVIMCMEYMDCGSLDRVSKVFGPVRVDVLGKITEAILSGLNYLYEVHRIMHRDIKPSNVLVSSRGNIKLCDFGVSGELVNSIADTFVGTSTYMAPERIQGAKYSIKSDVWSVGLTIMELAIGKFPFDASDATAEEGYTAPAGILDLLQQIVHEPAPVLPKADAFPPILDQMIQKCLLKDPQLRPTPRQLYDKDHFVAAAKRTPVDLRQWAVELMDKENRKSHLAPQLSPATQALLRGESGISPAKESPEGSKSKTPTSGEIPIGGQEVKASPSSDAVGSRTPSTITPASSTGSRMQIPDTNGSGSYSAKGPVLERPFPPRTSSNSLLPRTRDSTNSATAAVAAQIRSPGYNPAIPPSRNKDHDGFSLPIRPAPPPSGPLPTPPPSSFKQPTSKRQGTNGLSFNNEPPQY